VIHSTGKHVNEVLGISDERAYELVEITRPLWEKLISGKEGENFTVTDILRFIIDREKLSTEEKCFLCAHISRSFEIVVISELFLSGNCEGFVKELGLAKK